jgi:hypothetical protein
MEARWDGAPSMGAVDGFEICIAHLTFRRDTGSVDVSASELRIAPRHVDGISAAASGGVASTSFAGLGPTFGPRIGMVGRSVRSTTEFIATMDRTFLRANVTELVQCSHITPRAGHSCNKPVATMPGRKRKRDVVPKTDAALSVSPLVALLRSGDLSILGAIKHELPEVFAAEILPKLDMEATLNLAQVNKFYNKTVWSVDGVRSLGAKLESAFEKLKLASKASRIPFRPIPQSVFTEPIHWAAGRGNLPAVRALLDSGVDVDKAATYHRIFPNTRYGSSGVNSTEGEIALQCAAKKGHLAVVKALIKAGADVNRQDNYENTALGAATAQGSTLVVMELIKAGADVNLADDMGATPIFSAAELGNSIIVALLIQAGADVNRIDEDDMKPIDLALRYSNDDDWREDLGANGASIEEYKKCVEMLRYAAS